jgi:hypothetical protein
MNLDNLNTYEDWSGALEKLLDRAQAAVAGTSGEKPGDVADEIIDYYKNCSSPIKTKELDEIASNTVKNMLAGALDKAATDIANGTVALTALTKEVNAITDANNSDAASIRLDAARKVVDTTVQVVQALTTLKQHLDASQPDDKKIADSITTLIGTIQTVRNQVETMNHPGQ